MSSTKRCSTTRACANTLHPWQRVRRSMLRARGVSGSTRVIEPGWVVGIAHDPTLHATPSRRRIRIALDRDRRSGRSLPSARRRHLPLAEIASRYGRAESMVRNWCAHGLLPGAYRMNGREWLIPSAALASLRGARAARDDGSSSRERHTAPDLSAWRRIGELGPP
jgi:hypothetical protein